MRARDKNFFHNKFIHTIFFCYRNADSADGATLA